MVIPKIDSNHIIYPVHNAETEKPSWLVFN